MQCKIQFNLNIIFSKWIKTPTNMAHKAEAVLLFGKSTELITLTVIYH